MNIDKISSNPNNQSFQALHINRKALRNTGYLTKKSLLKNIPSLGKLAERAEVVVSRGARNDSYYWSKSEKVKNILTTTILSMAPLATCLALGMPVLSWVAGVIGLVVAGVNAWFVIDEEKPRKRNEIKLDVYPQDSKIDKNEPHLTDTCISPSRIKSLILPKYMRFANEHLKGPEPAGINNVKGEYLRKISNQLKYLSTPDKDGNLPFHYSLEELRVAKNLFTGEVLEDLLMHYNLNGDLPIHTYLDFNYAGDDKVAENIKKFLDEVILHEANTIQCRRDLIKAPDSRGVSIFKKYNSPRYKGCPELFKEIMGENAYNKATQARNDEIAIRECNEMHHIMLTGGSISLDKLKKFNELAQDKPELLKKFYTSDVSSYGQGKTVIYAEEHEEYVLNICETLAMYPDILSEVLLHEYDFAKASILSQYIKNDKIAPYIKSVLSPEEYKDALQKYEKDKENALSKLRDEMFSGQNVPKEQLARYFRVLAEEEPEAIVEYLNSTTNSRSPQRSRDRYQDIPFDTLTSALKNRTDLLSEIYFYKGNHSQTLFETFIKYQYDSLLNLLDVAKDDIEFLNTALNKLNEMYIDKYHDGVVKFAQKVRETIENHLANSKKEVVKIKPKLSFNDPKPIMQLLSHPRVVNSKGKALAYMLKGNDSPIICKVADLFMTEQNKDDYMKMIETLKKLPNIDYNQSDIMGIPFIEKVLNSENELLFDIVKNKEFEYYPILDKVFERISGEEFKEKAAKLNIKFPDIEEAVRVSSIEALDALAEQFKSPFFNKKYAKKLMHQATKSTPEFMMYLATAYKDYLPEYALEYFTGLQVARNQNK